MTTFTIPAASNDREDSIRWRRLTEVQSLCRTYLRPPSDVLDDGSTLTVVFTPDLTPSDVALLRRIVAMTGMMRITPDEWGLIEPAISTLRTARARTDAEWTALTAAQRDSELIAWCRGITDVLRALLRD